MRTVLMTLCLFGSAAEAMPAPDHQPPPTTKPATSDASITTGGTMAVELEDGSTMHVRWDLTTYRRSGEKMAAFKRRHLELVAEHLADPAWSPDSGYWEPARQGRYGSVWGWSDGHDAVILIHETGSAAWAEEALRWAWHDTEMSILVPWIGRGEDYVGGQSGYDCVLTVHPYRPQPPIDGIDP